MPTWISGGVNRTQTQTLSHCLTPVVFPPCASFPLPHSPDSPILNTQLQLLVLGATLACTGFTKLTQSGQQACVSGLVWWPTPHPDYAGSPKVATDTVLSLSLLAQQKEYTAHSISI